MSAALLLIVVFMCCLSLSGGIAGGLYMFGSECTGDDKNGVYERKWDGTCVLKSCNTGWTKSGETCVAEEDKEAAARAAEQAENIAKVNENVQTQYQEGIEGIDNAQQSGLSPEDISTKLCNYSSGPECQMNGCTWTGSFSPMDTGTADQCVAPSSPSSPPPPPPPPPPAVDCYSFNRNEDACVNAGCSWDFSGCSV